MKRIRKRRRTRKRVRFGAPDESLTGSSGVAALAELVDRLGVVGLLDGHVGSVKARDRGVSAGQLLVGLAQCQLLGGDCLTALDRQRQDTAAGLLSAVPAIPSTTAASLAGRFGPEAFAGIESATAALTGRVFDLLDPARRAALSGGATTIDMDSTDVEVYGRHKRGVAYNYAGQRAGRPHLATWAEAGLTVAADLLAGNDDVRPRAADLLGRALAALPGPVREQSDRGERWSRVRADAGYFTAELAHAAVEHGCDFAIAAKRNTAMWRVYAGIDDTEWTPATGMAGAEVAACDYAPAGWPEHTYTIVRRVRVDAEQISADPRSRRRRTIDPDQLALALDGRATHAYAVSFIVSNIPTGGTGDTGDDRDGGARLDNAFDRVVDVEAWFRRRTDIEDRIREAKLGAALRRLPSGDPAVNTVWMWASLLASNLSVWLQALTGLDHAGRAHAARLRHQLLCVPARIIRHARGLTLRLPPGPQLLPIVLARLRRLPLPA